MVLSGVLRFMCGFARIGSARVVVSYASMYVYYMYKLYMVCCDHIVANE